MTVARVKIDLATGLIELEGEHDFVGTHLDKLLPLLKSGDLRAPGKPAPAGGASDTGSTAPDTPDDNSESGQRRKKKMPKRPPSGASCRDRILQLKAEGFFKEHRTPTDIVGGLGKKGWTHKNNQISAALVKMFESGEIQRTKNEDGRGFYYFWDR